MDHSVPLTNAFNSDIFSDKPGVYMVQDVDGSSYVGSSINASTRWSNHYDNLNKGSSKFYSTLRQDISAFRFDEIAHTTDYRVLFFDAYPESLKSTDLRLINQILRVFVQYEARCLEQTIISAINPNLNTNMEVSI